MPTKKNRAPPDLRYFRWRRPETPAARWL